jgi:hypothetical protein
MSRHYLRLRCVQKRLVLYHGTHFAVRIFAFNIGHLENRGRGAGRFSWRETVGRFEGWPRSRSADRQATKAPSIARRAHRSPGSSSCFGRAFATLVGDLDQAQVGGRRAHRVAPTSRLAWPLAPDRRAAPAPRKSVVRLPDVRERAHLRWDVGLARLLERERAQRARGHAIAVPASRRKDLRRDLGLDPPDHSAADHLSALVKRSSTSSAFLAARTARSRSTSGRGRKGERRLRLRRREAAPVEVRGLEPRAHDGNAGELVLGIVPFADFLDRSIEDRAA